MKRNTPEKKILRTETTQNWTVTFINAFWIALDTLWMHKLRSALTLFGIIIGIAAVVLVGATLGVLRESIERSIAQTFGTDNFLIARVGSVGNLDRKALAEKIRKNPEIYRREAERLAERIEPYARTVPVLQNFSDVKAGKRMFLTAQVIGSNPTIQAIRDIVLSSGRFYTETENRRSKGVAVIGQALVDELFPEVDPLGKEIRIMGRLFVVIGVEEKQGSSFGNSLDRNAYIPLGAYEKIWGSRNSVDFYVQPNDPERFHEIQETARFHLRILRRLKPNAPDNFDILTPEANRDFLAQIIEMIGIAIVPISSVALIVAGIVVMNMMLVSVTERTREIGIRKSLGARNGDILAQVLLESTILTILGGAAGLLISYLAAFGLDNTFGSKVTIQPEYILMALTVAATIGIGAGIFPALLASRMSPVEALGSET
ncbi:MAG: ABC transporter permease [Acidobacteria bacterium]|nr:ABC transporter permease [Acidobacteriota bacterium]